MPKGIYTRGTNSRHENCRGHASSAFWLRVNKNGPIHPVPGQCWVWTASTIRGYGQFRNGRAHRFSYLDTYGEIPNESFVLHKCDNPICVRPDHLFLGTAQDNMNDKVSKGRQGDSGTKTPPTGEKNVKAVLTEEMVIFARRMDLEGLSVRQINDMFGNPVSSGALKMAITGRTWSHLP